MATKKTSKPVKLSDDEIIARAKKKLDQYCWTYDEEEFEWECKKCKEYVYSPFCCECGAKAPKKPQSEILDIVLYAVGRRSK